MLLPQKLEKEIKQLSKKKYRREYYRYVVEGIKCVQELLGTDIKPNYTVVSESFEVSEKGIDIIKILNKNNFEYYVVKDDVFRKLVDTVSPQGILSVVPMKFQPLETALNMEESKIFILDCISDPGNLGTIIRAAVAFGMTGIIISENSVELYNNKVIRSALGTHFHIPVICDMELSFIKNELKKRGFEIYSTDANADMSYRNITTENKKIAIVIGNEHHGVSEMFAEDEDVKKVRIPIDSKVESLNAAVTASVMMSYLTKIK